MFPGSQYSDEFWDFTGRWVGEFQVVKNHWQPGVRLRENLTGRTGHEHFPGLIVKGDGASETAGEVFGFHMAGLVVTAWWLRRCLTGGDKSSLPTRLALNFRL